MKTLRTIILLGSFTLLAFAQSSTELKRPTTDSDPGSVPTWANTNCGIGTYTANSTSGALARDSAGQTTSIKYLTSALTTAGKRNLVKIRIFKTWDTTSNSYSALTLNVASSSTGPDIEGKVCSVYSTDAGVTWTAIRCDTTSFAQVTSTISLGAGQPLSDLQVGVCVRSSATASDGGADNLTLFDIWTSGTLGSAAVGTGSSSGTAVQPVQFN